MQPVEIIKDKLFFITVDGPEPPPNPRAMFFSTDNSLVYTAFFADFGPLDLGLVHQFCETLKGHLVTAASQGKVVYYYCANHMQRRANSAFLLCAFMVFVMGCSAEAAYAPFIGIQPPLAPFRDAAFSINTYPVTVLDCTRAMARAVSGGHYNHNTFDLAAFQHMAKLQNGDFSWIIPGKFLAFSGPLSKRRELSDGVYSLLPHEYIPIMKSLGVTCIVRFNSKCYDRTVFTSAGIRHVDLYYEDGGNPTENILQAFLQVCENEKGAIAVHCKAGLGRTGTNIAAYMMKHMRYTAREAIAWCRICRPGSVVGPQQQFLLSIEAKMIKEGELYRAKYAKNAPAGAGASARQSVGSLAGSFGRMGIAATERSVTPPIDSDSGNRPSSSAAPARPLLVRSGSRTDSSGAQAQLTSNSTPNAGVLRTGSGQLSSQSTKTESGARQIGTGGAFASRSTEAASSRPSTSHHTTLQQPTGSRPSSSLERRGSNSSLGQSSAGGRSHLSSQSSSASPIRYGGSSSILASSAATYQYASAKQAASPKR